MVSREDENTDVCRNVAYTSARSLTAKKSRAVVYLSEIAREAISTFGVNDEAR